MTPDCLRLDDYLDGRLSEPESEAFETHTAGCSDCDAALDGALALGGLAALRDETCPPAVVAAALRSARRAPDRAAVPSARRSRLSLVVLALAAAVAIVVGLSWPDAPDTPAVAEADVPAPTVADEPAPVPASPEPLADAATPDAAPPSPAPPPAVRDTPTIAPVPPPAPAPASPEPQEATTPPDDAIAQADGSPDDAPEAAPTAEEIADAQRDLALAFSLIAEAQTRAGDALRSHAGPVSATIDHALPF